MDPRLDAIKTNVYGGDVMHMQAKDKSNKDFEKAKKVLEPLSKKLAEDPAFMTKLAGEVDELTKQIQGLST